MYYYELLKYIICLHQITIAHVFYANVVHIKLLKYEYDIIVNTYYILPFIMLGSDFFFFFQEMKPFFQFSVSNAVY